MHANHDQHVIALFGGERVAVGRRGRRSSQMDRRTGHVLAVVLAVLLVGFTTAATAITARRHAAIQAHTSAGANSMIAPAVAGFEAALY